MDRLELDVPCPPSPVRSNEVGSSRTPRTHGFFLQQVDEGGARSASLAHAKLVASCFVRLVALRSTR